MQFILPAKKTLEQLIAYSIQKWNYESSRNEPIAFLFPDDVFASPLKGAFEQAGYNIEVRKQQAGYKAWEIMGVRSASYPTGDNLSILSDWPDDRILSLHEIVLPSIFARSVRWAQRNGYVQTNNPDVIKYLTDNNYACMNNTKGLFCTFDIASIPHAIEFQNRLTVHCCFNRSRLVSSDLCKKDLMLAAGYILRDALAPVDATLKLLSANTFVEEAWDLAEFQSNLIPANVRLTNGQFLLGLSIVAEYIEHPRVGEQFVQFLPLSGISFELLKEIVQANGYQLFATADDDCVYWLIDLLGTASVGDVRLSYNQKLYAAPGDVVLCLNNHEGSEEWQ